MNFRNGENRTKPTPEDLAAYLDGEFEGDDARIPQKQLVEEWLADHPEAFADLTAWRRLKQIWQDTTPELSEESRWAALLSRIQHDLTHGPKPTVPAPKPFPWGWVSGFAAALLLTVGFLIWQGQSPKPEKKTPSPSFSKNKSPSLPTKPFPVVAADEIQILHVGGEDISGLVIGAPPMEGVMPMAGPDEIVFTSVQTSQEEDPEPNIKNNPPMIWVPMDKE